MAAGSAPGAGQDPPPGGAPSRPVPSPSAPKSSRRCREPSPSAAGWPGPAHSAPGQPVPGSPDQSRKPSSPVPHRLGRSRSAPGDPGLGHRDPAAPSGDVGDPPVPCGEAGAWWEGDELVDEDDLDAAGWVDPPGEPLDEQAIKAARAAAISAEVLGAGFWPKNGADPEARPGAGPVLRSRSGFGSGDDVDELEPGPALAGLTDTASRPDRIADLDDDELIGALRAWRRLESWSAAGTLSVVAELARRRPADGTAPANPGQFPDQPSEFLTDEVAFALTLTGPAAGTCLDLALDLAIRLPGTAHALRAGIIDYLRARIIAEATRILSPDDARRVEAVVLAKAGQQTSGQLRAVLARTILAIDPEAAQRRREQAQKDPRIRRWRENAGTAALAGYGLPPADVLEADQHLTERALNLREAACPALWTSSAPAPTSMPSWAATPSSPRNWARPANLRRRPAPRRLARTLAPRRPGRPPAPRRLARTLAPRRPRRPGRPGRRPAPDRPGPLKPRRLQRPRCSRRRLILSRAHPLPGPRRLARPPAPRRLLTASHPLTPHRLQRPPHRRRLLILNRPHRLPAPHRPLRPDRGRPPPPPPDRPGLAGGWPPAST